MQIIAINNAVDKFFKWYRHIILPRTVFIPFIVCRCILEALNIFTYRRFDRKAQGKALLCIEAGSRGWDLIEYRELLVSAEEYMGRENTRKVAIDRGQSYISQVLDSIHKFRPTHYLYDSRTGSEQWLTGLWQSFCIAILFQWHGVIPICILTDLPVRSWRAQTSVVSAKRGIVISLMLPYRVSEIFPHRRLIGPQMMAFSQETLNKLVLLDEEFKSRFFTKRLIFTGSMYEPRRSIIEEIRQGLSTKGITLEVKGRTLGTARFTDEEYWKSLASATLVITTANMAEQPGLDWAWSLHLIYRYLEVPACGSVLIAQEIPGLSRYMQPDIHYISYTTPQEAIEKVLYYWNNPEELQRIAIAGRERIRSLIRLGLYWICVDTALQTDSLIR